MLGPGRAGHCSRALITGAMSVSPGKGDCCTTTHSGVSGPGGPAKLGTTVSPDAAARDTASGHLMPRSGTAVPSDGTGEVSEVIVDWEEEGVGDGDWDASGVGLAGEHADSASPPTRSNPPHVAAALTGG